MVVELLEIARRRLRGVLPFSFYARLSRIVNDLFTIRNMGLRDFLDLRKLLLETAGPFGGPVPVRVRGIRHPIFVRPGTTDAAEVVHTCIREVYGKFLPAGDIKVIVDAGANIGDTAVWYLNRFPEATVIAIEPDENNFRLLEQNCRPYGNRVILVNAALWPTDGEVLGIVGSSMESGISVASEKAAGTMTCTSVSMTHLLGLTALRRVDIFKCDIEGSETTLFANGAEAWLPSVRSVAVEVHSAESRDVVLSAASRFGFSCLQYRDIYVLRR